MYYILFKILLHTKWYFSILSQLRHLNIYLVLLFKVSILCWLQPVLMVWILNLSNMNKPVFKRTILLNPHEKPEFFNWWDSTLVNLTNFKLNFDSLCPNYRWLRSSSPILVPLIRSRSPSILSSFSWPWVPSFALPLPLASLPSPSFPFHYLYPFLSYPFLSYLYICLYLFPLSPSL